MLKLAVCAGFGDTSCLFDGGRSERMCAVPTHARTHAHAHVQFIALKYVRVLLLLGASTKLSLRR